MSHNFFLQRCILIYFLLPEKEEVYDLSLKGLDYLPAGNYTLQYTDGTNVKTMTVSKQTAVTKKAPVRKPVTVTEAVQ